MTYLQIPEEIDGMPVTAIARSAFSRKEDLKYVKLPAALRKLERFAFYGCINLERISLSDGIEDLYDGAFRYCRKLKETELDLACGRFIVLRELLGDSDRTMCYHLHLADGEARLTFPDYVTDYREDTRARAMHFHIEGAGFYYRECVSRNGIDFHGYDKSFDRVRYGDPQLAAQIALDRVTLPYQLGAADAGMYRTWIMENAETVIRLTIAEKRQSWLRYLVQNDLLDEPARQTGLRLAAEQKSAELVPILMNRQKENTETGAGRQKDTAPGSSREAQTENAPGGTGRIRRFVL